MKNKILIIDNEDDVNFLFKIVLEDNGYTVDVFNDPLVALQNFTAGSYDLLLLDMAMPKMNGFELYQKIRKLDDKVKVCFLTASETNFEKLKMKIDSATIDYPENCFISKPIENEELVKRIRSQLE
jgi:DNA-binding response OmpR family regulator